MGLPVVATDVGGIPEAVEHGVEGLLVPSGDPTDLARAYCELALDPQRRARMAAAAVTRSAAFDVRLTQRRLEETYRLLVARARS